MTSIVQVFILQVFIAQVFIAQVFIVQVCPDERKKRREKTFQRDPRRE